MKFAVAGTGYVVSCLPFFVFQEPMCSIET